MTRRNTFEDISQHIDTSGGADACHLWTRRRCRGYGAVTMNGKQTLVHRAVWEHTHGAIPVGQHVLHRCDTPACCNLQHLFLGTQLDNMRDMRAKGRQNYLEGFSHGHEGYSGEKNGKAVITDHQAEEIRCLYALGGHTHRSLAKQIGVSKSAITAILNNKTYTHVRPNASSGQYLKV